MAGQLGLLQGVCARPQDFNDCAEGTAIGPACSRPTGHQLRLISYVYESTGLSSRLAHVPCWSPTAPWKMQSIEIAGHMLQSGRHVLEKGCRDLTCIRVRRCDSKECSEHSLAVLPVRKHCQVCAVQLQCCQLQQPGALAQHRPLALRMGCIACHFN